MVKVKQSFSRGEVFHAWVNKSGLSYYKSSNSYNSITGYNNVLFAGDKVYNFKKDITDKELSDHIKYNYSSSVIAIINRDKKEIIINDKYFDLNIRSALSKDYTIYVTLDKLDDYNILYDKEYCLKADIKRSITRLYTIYYATELLVLNGVSKVCHSNIEHLYEKDKTSYGEFCNFIKDNNIDKYDWYNFPILNNVYITKYSGWTKTNVKINNIKSIKDIVTGNLFSKDELLLLEQRQFWTKYCFNKSISFKEVQSKWNKSFENKDLKESRYKYDTDFITWREYITIRSNTIDKIDNARNEEYRRLNQKNLEEAIKKYNELYPNLVESWRKYNNSVTAHSIPYTVYQKDYRSGRFEEVTNRYYGDNKFHTTQLKLYDNNKVITSQKCIVPLADAIRLYKLVETTLLGSTNIEPNSKTLIKDFRDRDIKCGIYKLLEIYCNIKPNTTRLEFCVVIGCHHLWMDDIKDFINYYKLNKEFEL